MAASTVWGLDIGQCALKAVKARVSGQLVQVLAFDHIEYRQALSTAGTDASATIREALQTFLSRNDVEACGFSVSIAAGRSALVRFIKLPPVDRRKVPDIVKYEATQQIPFPLEDVIWDHQVIEREYAPGEELEVGLFAMRRDAVYDFLSNLMVSGIDVDSIQLTAIALYNCVRYDQPTTGGAIMAVDMGAESTNLVVVDGNSVWTRSLPIGGNDFTRAIATKYGMDFDQAENLKRNIDRSKKAQEIFEALRPSLKSLLDEIQRSAGYYRSIHKTAKFVKLLGFGAAFRMFGVQRFLEAGLAYPVEVFEKTNNIVVEGAINQQFFKKSSCAYGVALGLVVQGLGAAGINTTLMPPAIMKERLLKQKRPFFIAAAATLALAFAWPAMSAFTMPVNFDIAKQSVYNDVHNKSKAQKQYEEILNVNDIQTSVDGIISLRKQRAAQMDAFNALVASIPQDPARPIYIERISVETGDFAFMRPKLISPLREASKGQGDIFHIETVVNPDFISRAAQAAKDRKTARGGRALTAAEGAALVDAREAAMVMAEALREERRDERIKQREAKTAKTTKTATGVVLQGTQFTFKGVAQLANIYLDIPEADAAPFARAICDNAKKNVPGVMYCELIVLDPESFWEHSATHARSYSIPPFDLAQFYKKVTHTTAILQWVYQPGGKPWAAAAGKKAATTAVAEAPVAGQAQAEAPVAGQAPESPEAEK